MLRRLRIDPDDVSAHDSGEGDEVASIADVEPDTPTEASAGSDEDDVFEPTPKNFKKLRCRLWQEDITADPVATDAYFVPLYNAAGIMEDGDTLLAALVRTGDPDAFDNPIARSIVQHQVCLIMMGPMMV